MLFKPCVLAAALLTAGSMPALAEGAELLRIIGQDRQFVIQTPAGPLAITRSMTACARNEGFLQSLVPSPGVRPVTEIEVLQALNDLQSQQNIVLPGRHDGLGGFGPDHRQS
jgi:hypothetical protein